MLSLTTVADALRSSLDLRFNALHQQVFDNNGRKFLYQKMVFDAGQNQVVVQATDGEVDFVDFEIYSSDGSYERMSELYSKVLQESLSEEQALARIKERFNNAL